MYPRLLNPLLAAACMLASFASPLSPERAHAAAPSGVNPFIVSAPESMTYVLSFWLVEFKRDQRVATRIETVDADAVVPALVEGRSTLVAMPRRMTEGELRAGAPSTRVTLSRCGSPSTASPCTCTGTTRCAA